MTYLFRGLLAAACTLAVLTPAAYAGPTVTIRVEGGNATLVPPTQVTLPGPAVDKTAEGGTTCSPDSAGSALEAATGGDWGGRQDGQGQRIERIKGEVNLMGGEYAGRFWSIYVNKTTSYSGICSITPQQGDEILITPQCGGATDRCFDDVPLDLTAPATARPGTAFAVTVDEYPQDYSGPTASTTRTPSSGATVAGGGQTATTGADGRATLTLTQRGPVVLTATKGQHVRESATVCVTDGADGFCGTTAPSGQTGLGGPAPAAPPAFVPDLTAPKALIGKIEEGEVIRRRNAPKLLEGRVEEAGGVLMVKLRLTRTNRRGKCFTYSRTRERFVKRKCGAKNGWWFRIGDRADWEYQLAKKLPRGRYVLDVNAIDTAYNRDDERRRGENRVVFRVR